jgi:GDPmannose 4,6-dehydratase
MKSALITGIAGQDGTYMAELLISKGYRVFGLVRNVNKALESFTPKLVSHVELLEWNLLDQEGIADILARVGPDEVYNFAACSSGSGMYDDPVWIGEMNGLGVVRILDSIRKTDPNIRFCQASSSEMFGGTLESPQSEETPFHPRSPYGAAKLYGHSMIHIYRQHYGMFACSAILFNHESPRRSLGFVTRKITYHAAKIKLGLANELSLGNLDARRDWGFAGDTVRAMWLMLQQAYGDDYVVATGETHSVRELCEIAFGHLGLDYRDYIRADSFDYRPVEPIQLVGNPEKARNQLGWIPEIGFLELIKMMVDADMSKLAAQKQVHENRQDYV